ncbi:MAG TPA: tetratricopeptide repeat protein, partial [Anaerolineales bacterium]|nr:tetratricopeptide repeat protein [Anaerolineales bacterium]
MSRRQAGVVLLVTAAVLVACAGLPALLPGTATPPPPTATITPTPTATPSPTPSPAVHLEAAGLALRNGDWDRALQEYQSAANSADPGPQGDGQFGVGETYVRAGLYGQGAEALTTFLSLHADHPRAADAYFLRATARRALRDVDGAVADFDAYLQTRPGVIDSYVQEWQGDVLEGAGRHAEAAARYQSAATLPRIGPAASLYLKAGRAYLDGGDATTALTLFNTAYEVAPDDAARASANLYAGRALVALGDREAGYARWLDSVEKYPAALDTYEGLVELVDADVPVDSYRRGFIDFLAGAYEPAIQAFGRAIDREPSAEAYYYRGLSRRGSGDYSGALEDLYVVYVAYPDFADRETAWLEAGRTASVFLGDYSRARSIYLDLVAALPGSANAPQALLSAGKSAEVEDDLQGAIDTWLRVPVEYPQSSLASQAAFLAGITRVRLGDVAGAAEAFRLAGDRAQTGADRAAAALWVGKILEAQGRHDEAVGAWQTAAASDVTGYYSARAADLLAGRKPFEPTGVFTFPTDQSADQAEAEAWLRTTFTLTDTAPLDRL